MRLRREIVNLVRDDVVQKPRQVRAVCLIAEVQRELRAKLMPVVAQMVNAAGVERRGSALDAVNLVALVQKEFGADKFDTVAPSISILAEPSVSVVDKVVDKRGTRKVAEEYLKYLYSPEGQEIAAKNFYRPRLPEIARKYEANLPKLQLFTIDDVFGGWKKAQAEHFADKGIFDQIYKPAK